MLKYNEFINENKMWFKTIPQFLSWLEEKSNNDWIWLDTETTGLRGPKHEQLTQIAAIATTYNFSHNEFTDLGSYDVKIELTPDTLTQMKDPTSRIKWVLSFNHYGKSGIKYHDEAETLQEFHEWVKQWNNPLLVIQNAQFDMNMINVRNTIVKFKNEVFDTKMMLQLYYLPLLQTLSETNDEYKKLVNKIGTSDRDNGLISSSMSKVGPALGVDMTNYHDALTDCRLAMDMTKRVIQFLKDNQHVDIMKYQIQRIKLSNN